MNGLPNPHLQVRIRLDLKKLSPRRITEILGLKKASQKPNVVRVRDLVVGMYEECHRSVEKAVPVRDRGLLACNRMQL